MTFSSFVDHVRAGGTLRVVFFLLSIFLIYHSLNQDPLKLLPSHFQRYMFNEDEITHNDTVYITKLKQILGDINSDRNISNLDKYGPMTDDTPVLLVQVHRDVERLQFLIFSLAQVRDVQSTLLIFSHSYYDEKINRLIGGIGFCKVMQIFYPHSLQLHPHKFPGVDDEDCSPGADIKDCIIRDARVTENKQHWWWKANFVFKKMQWAKSHNALVIFLEENNYVAPDLMHMLQYAQRALLYFPKVNVMSFGRPFTKTVDMDLLVLEPWRPPFDVGLAFNRTTWKNIESFSAQYCMFNDRSWSYSLSNLLKGFPKGYASMVACVTPRVLSTKEFVSPKVALTKLLKVFSPSNLFPDKVHAVFLFGRDGVVQRPVQTPREGNGGWDDLRDQLLCLDPLFNNTNEGQRYDDAEFTSAL